MSLTNTVPLAAAALLVLEKEMLYTDALALRTPITTELTDLQAAQTAYEIEVLSRTPGAVGAISPLTV
jgi:hypothetical protein